jgi:hypothetical protein
MQSGLLSVIPPEAPADTYTLLRNADKVLTFGSTVGIEAVFWGKPSILAGPSFYRNLGGTYNPSSHEELLSLLREDLEPKDRLPAIRYGYYMNSYGIPFRHYEAEDFAHGRFRGRDLNSTGISWPIFIYLRLREILGKQ